MSTERVLNMKKLGYFLPRSAFGQDDVVLNEMDGQAQEDMETTCRETSALIKISSINI